MRHYSSEIVGKKVGHALVLKDLGTFNKAKKYLVRCTCGYIHEAYAKSLILCGKNKSDYQCQLCKKDSSRLFKIRILTDMESRALHEWKKMTRIVYPFSGTQKKFAICHEWNDFFVFLAEMKEPKIKESLLKLKIGIGEYNKANCVWMRTDDFRTVQRAY